MRQVFFLLVAAMFIAFSLSWASAEQAETYYMLPENVILPVEINLKEKPEVSVSVPLDASCESIESIHQEIRGHKIIFAIRIQQLKNQFCFQDSHHLENVNLVIDRFSMDSSKKVDVYFREDEESLKYFGTIEMKEK
jgi:hypothetical protein